MNDTAILSCSWHCEGVKVEFFLVFLMIHVLFFFLDCVVDDYQRQCRQGRFEDLLIRLLLGFNAEIPCRVSSMYAVRPNLHAVLGPGRDTHLNAGEVESTASGWFLCSAFHTIRRWYQAGLALPRLVFFFAGEVECQMGPDWATD